MERGVFPIRLVRSEAGAAALANLFPGSPVFRDRDGWLDGAGARRSGGRPIHVAIDSVGGRLLGLLRICGRWRRNGRELWFRLAASSATSASSRPDRSP